MGKFFSHLYSPFCFPGVTRWGRSLYHGYCCQPTERGNENDFPPQDLEASGHEYWLEIFMLDFHFKFKYISVPRGSNIILFPFTYVRSARACSHVFCLFLNGAHASAKRKLWRYFLRQTFYTDEGVIPETFDNLTLKFGTRNLHFLVLIISYEYHAAKTYFVTYLCDLVLEILRFSWYFGRCSWFFGGCSGFSGECSWFSGECSWFSGECSWFSGGISGFLVGVQGFRWCSGFSGCSGMFRCSGVPGSTTCRQQMSWISMP